MFSVVWEVRAEANVIEGLCTKYNLPVTPWKKGDRITSKRDHSTYGFRWGISDCTSTNELNEGLMEFVQTYKNCINEISSLSQSSEIDIGITIDIEEVSAVSLSFPLKLQLSLSELGTVIVFTVMLSDDCSGQEKLATGL
jgi:hypothetical protein